MVIFSTINTVIFDNLKPPWKNKNKQLFVIVFSRMLQTVKNRIVISDDLQNDQLKNTCKIIKRDNFCKTDFSFCINENTKRVY